MADSNLDESPISSVTVVNNEARGPRYVHTARGMEVIPAGGFLETEMSANQVKAAERQIIDDADGAPLFTIEGGEHGDDADPRAKLTVTQLRKLAEEMGVQLTGRTDGDGKSLPDITKRADLLAAIDAHQATE